MIKILQKLPAGRARYAAWIFFLILALPRFASAHRSSDSYVSLVIAGESANIEIEIALTDLEVVLALDADHNGVIVWSELQQKEDGLKSYVTSHIALTTSGTPIPLELQELVPGNHPSGAYAVLKYAARIPTDTQEVTLRYQLLFEHDPQHRGLLTYTKNGETALRVLGPDKPVITLQLHELQKNSVETSIEFVHEGIWHIWLGYDHVLFLLSLLFPAVLVRERGGWHGVSNFGSAFWKIFGIVTSFTLAHTLTLAAATFGLVEIPSRIVESLIAASVCIAALNNLFPIIRREYIITFVFGLVHGLGFASVLSEMQLSGSNLVPGLLGFNLGVELGQLAIVFAVMPVAFFLRDTTLYRRAILQGGSCAVIIVASTWFVERAFDVQILGF